MRIEEIAHLRLARGVLHDERREVFTRAMVSIKQSEECAGAHREESAPAWADREELAVRRVVKNALARIEEIAHLRLARGVLHYECKEFFTAV